MGFPALTASTPYSSSSLFDPEQNQECVLRGRRDAAPFSIKEDGYIFH